MAAVPANQDNYPADHQLLMIVINLVSRLKLYCYICDMVLLLYTYFIFNKYGADIQTFAFAEGGMIIFLAALQYALIVEKGRFITKTAIDIDITGQHLQIRTSAFKGPLWFRRDSALLKFPRTGTAISLIKNPYPRIFRESRRIFRLSYNGREAFIIDGYFQWQLEEELRKGAQPLTL